MHQSGFRRTALLSTLTVLLGSTALGSGAWAQSGGQGGPPPLARTAPANGTRSETSPATPASAPPTPGAGSVAAPPAADPAVPAASAGPTAAEIAAQTGVVNRVVVQGNERIETGTILSYLPISVGDTVDAAKLDAAIKALNRTELFADIKVELNPAIGELVVRVVENPIINQVTFEGNSALNNDKLKDEVSVHPRGIFTRARVAQDVQRIVELYRRSGRIGASVNPKIVELPQRRVDLVFEITEGAKTGIARINVLGNKAFSDNALRDQIVTRESHWYKFFSSNDNFDPDRIEYDREQLRKFYTNRGYYDFRTVSSVAELQPDQRAFALNYVVDEGAKYSFGKLRVQTDVKKLNGDLLRQLLPIREGQLYQSDRIEQAVDALTFAAGAAGFAFVDIRPRYSANRDTHTVDVTFEVKEGDRVYVERIDVVGNTRTLDPVIRRELRIAEGDAYNQVLVDRSKIEVKRLDFFKTVDVDKLPGSAPDRAVLRVKVQEQPTGQLSLGAGYSTVDKLLLDVGVSESNLGGRGQDLRVRASVGSLRQTIDLGFTEPRFLGRDLRAGADLYTYRYDFTNEAGYSSQSTGGDIRLSFPLNANTLLSTRYALHTDAVVVEDTLCDPTPIVSATLCAQRGSRLTSSLGYTLAHDERNDPRRATRGYFVTLNQDLAGVGGDVHYLKSEISGAIYHGFTSDFVGSFQAQAGYVVAFSGDSVRINDRFFKGGNTFRGFATAGIGPRDTTYGDALGGNLYAIGAFQLSVPNFLPEQYGIRTALFTEFGTLGRLDDAVKKDAMGLALTSVADDLALRASVGLSVFWTSPLGPIRLDFSQVLAKQPYDKTEAFRFSTSTQF